mgnify:CR=1 FL=1
MFIFKKNYFLIIENTKDINLNNIKKNDKFILIYRNNNSESLNTLRHFRKLCRLKLIKFYIANNHKLAVLLRADGLYLSAKNRSFSPLNLKRLNLSLIGSAHNIKEINLKIKQNCSTILLSKLFKVSYSPDSSFLGVVKFNIVYNISKKIIPLGGINLKTLNKIKNIRSDGLAVMTEIKKKPVKLINRLF